MARFEKTDVPASAGRPKYNQYSDDVIRELIDFLKDIDDGEAVLLGEYADEATARGQARAAQRQLAQFNVTVGTSVWEVERNGQTKYASAIHTTTRTNTPPSR